MVPKDIKSQSQERAEWSTKGRLPRTYSEGVLIGVYKEKCTVRLTAALVVTFKRIII